MVIISIITKDPSDLDNDDHEWINIITKISSMVKFERLKSDLSMREIYNIEVFDIQKITEKTEDVFIFRLCIVLSSDLQIYIILYSKLF